jgi:DNA-binding protein Fis
MSLVFSTYLIYKYLLKWAGGVGWGTLSIMAWLLLPMPIRIIGNRSINDMVGIAKGMMDVIHTRAVEELVHAMEGAQPTLNIERLIDMQQAVLALDCGTPMATIVRDVSERLEQHLIQQVLILTQGNKSEAARRLRIDYKTLYRKLHKYAAL